MPIESQHGITGNRPTEPRQKPRRCHESSDYHFSNWVGRGIHSNLTENLPSTPLLQSDTPPTPFELTNGCCIFELAGEQITVSRPHNSTLHRPGPVPSRWAPGLSGGLQHRKLPLGFFPSSASRHFNHSQRLGNLRDGLPITRLNTSPGVGYPHSCPIPSHPGHPSLYPPPNPIA